MKLDCTFTPGPGLTQVTIRLEHNELAHVIAGLQQAQEELAKTPNRSAFARIETARVSSNDQLLFVIHRQPPGKGRQ